MCCLCFRGCLIFASVKLFSTAAVKHSEHTHVVVRSTHRKIPQKRVFHRQSVFGSLLTVPSTSIVPLSFFTDKSMDQLDAADVTENTGSLSMQEQYYIARDRMDLLSLTKNAAHIQTALDSLESHRYTSSAERTLLANTLQIYQHRFGGDISYELHELHKTSRHIHNEARELMRTKIIELVYHCKTAIDEFNPMTDRERFQLMVDGSSSIRTECWKELSALGAVMCQVFPRKFKLMGTPPAEQFYAGVKERWGFVDPERYFEYTGGVSVPVMVY